MHPLIIGRRPATTRACSPVADAVDAAIVTADADVESMPQAAFKIFTGLLTASLGEDNVMRLHGVASSTTRDLHGDTMTESALQDMERDANNNLTIFLNHSYNVPEDVAGSVVKAALVRRGVDGDGNPNYDLDYEIVIDETNERAVKAFKSIKAGTKLGLSIGALIPEGGAVRDKKSGALTINHVMLLETSIVSIPANPRSWVDRATGASKALLKAWREQGSLEKSQTHTLGSPTLTLSGDQYQISGSLNGLQLGSPEPAVTASAEPTEATAEPSVTDAGCPDCGGGKGSPKGDCGHGFHKDVEPDVTDSRVRIIEIDTDDGKSSDGDGSSPSGDSDSSGAEEDEWSVTPATTASVEPTVQLATQLENMDPGVATLVRGLFEQLQASTLMVAQLSMDLEKEQAARKDAERVRDEVALQAGTALQQVSDLVQRLADLPMGRKASFKAISDDLADIRSKDIYSESFLKLAQGR